MMTPAAVGYFVWVRSLRNEPPSPEKVDADTEDGMMPETRKRFEASRIGDKVPLTAAEFKLSLGELAEKYPYRREP